jgi:SWIM/SEC-C metal-binding protein
MQHFTDIKVYDGLKTAKLGTKDNPAVVTVQTKTRAKELEAIFKEKDWSFKIIIDKKKEEDISDLKILQHPVKTVVNKKEKVGRNDPCPCGSGKKYKHCHGAKE